MKKKFLFILLVVFSHFSKGQIVLENNPTSLRWKQINTSHFRVIFPQGFDLPAQRMANTLEQIHHPEARTLGTIPRKISVILQNQSSASNGFVSILPRRSEFYIMQPQDYNFIGTNDWLNLLATHEYRHVVQYQHAIRGFNKFFYYAFGSNTLAGMSQVAVPQWFWEGDAVATETAFTPSGRGRIPNFGLIFRTNLLEGRTFNYHKQYLRSYKHNIPNHYVLGYYMVSYLRKKSGDPKIWGKITARAWNVPFIPFTFSNAIRNQTGIYVTDLFNEMAADLKKEWQAEVDQLKLTPFEKFNNRSSKAYTDYLYPQPMEDGRALVMKRGIGDIEQFVIIDKDQNERKIFTPGFVNDAGMLSFSTNRIVWSEYGFDPRWAVRNYSLLKVYNLTSKYTKVVGGRHARLSGAALSPDGSKIVAVHAGQDYKISLQVFDVARGNKLKEFPNPENNFYSMPRWSDDGKFIVVVKTMSKGKTISKIDVATGAFEDIITLSQENVGHPILYQNYLFFNSPISGIDNIYAIDLQTKKRYQVTSSKYAAYNPAIASDGKTIYYNEQSADGLNVVTTLFEPSRWEEHNAAGREVNVNLFEHLVEEEGRPHLLDSIPPTMHPVTTYSKIRGILNPYSWGAFITNDLAQLNIGITSRDILSTTAINAGYLYDLNEGTSSWRAGVSYQGLYPIIDLDVSTGNRQNNERNFGRDIEFKWKELTVEGGLRIPLQLTSSKYSRRLSIGGAVGLTRVTEFENTITRNNIVVYKGPRRDVPAFDTLNYIYKDQLNDGDLVYSRLLFSFANLLKRSPRDFLSRWGQTLDIDLYNTPFGGDFEGRLMAARSALFFPGVFKHHFIFTRIAYQKSFQGIETNTYIFRNRIAKPRGHTYPSDETFFSISANYALPLWYPDIALGPVLNVQRIKANFFYDYGKGTGNTFYYKSNSNKVYVSDTAATYQSVGVETTFDFNVMRFLPKFEIGFRSTYRFSNENRGSGLVFEAVIGNIGF